MIQNVVWAYIIIGILAMICEYINSSMGGGYGTIIVPLLLIIATYNLTPIKLDPAIIVFYVLITETVTGFFAAGLHNVVGNAKFYEKNHHTPSERNVNSSTDNKSKKFTFLPLTADMKSVLVLSFCGFIGAIISVVVALSFNEKIVKTYIGVIVSCVGLFVLFKITWKFKWWKVWFVGGLAAFNKGVSGGGYGPLVTSGQLITDRNPRGAIAVTAFSEGVVSLTALITYIIGGMRIGDWWLILTLFLGAIFSVPFSVLTVKKLNVCKLRPLVGLFTVFLGVFTLIQVWILNG